MSVAFTADDRAELLAFAHRDELVPLAERLLSEGGLDGLSVIRPPQVGLVLMQVREPVADERFYLGEVLATQCSVELDGTPGWSMRGGDDRVTALAGAVLDALAAANRPGAEQVQALCVEVAQRRRREHEAEWEQIAPTAVTFEELP
jgi:alpha-D-ribose 1-methylphosphonate 5-triphosphate synthase subunit PhnG